MEKSPEMKPLSPNYPGWPKLGVTIAIVVFVMKYRFCTSQTRNFALAVCLT